MATRDIYERRFDEDIKHTDHNTCPECDGRVTTNTHETVCDDCGLGLTKDRERSIPGQSAGRDHINTDAQPQGN